MLSLKKKSAVLALAAGLTLGLAACGSDDADTGSNDTASTESEVSKEPVAKIDELSGSPGCARNAGRAGQQRCPAPPVVPV